jgi:hypothetical protein
LELFITPAPPAFWILSMFTSLILPLFWKGCGGSGSALDWF